MWESFVKFDKDGSGTLTRDEVEEMLEDEMCEAVTPEELDAAMNDMDEDNNGVIEFQEVWWDRGSFGCNTRNKSDRSCTLCLPK